MKAFNEKIILRNVAIDPSGGGKDLIAAINTPVTVYETGTTNLASLFDLDENPIANPVNTDLKGNVVFKVANGVYDIVGAAGTQDETRWDQSEISSDIDSSSTLVTATGAGAAKSLGDRFADSITDFASIADMVSNSNLVGDGGLCSVKQLDDSYPQSVFKVALSGSNDLVDSFLLSDGRYANREYTLSGDQFYSYKQRHLLGSALKKLREGDLLNVTWYGDSNSDRYGQELIDQFRIAMKNAYGDNSCATLDRATPGFSAQDGFNGYTADHNGDVSVMMYGSNDASEQDGYPFATNMQEYLYWMEKLIIRELNWGKSVVLLTPFPVRFDKAYESYTTTVPADEFKSTKRIDARQMGQALKYLGDKYSIPVIDTVDMVAPLRDEAYDNATQSIFDGVVMGDVVHLAIDTMGIVGARVAAAFVGDNLLRPVHVSDGSALTVRRMYDPFVINQTNYVDPSTMWKYNAENEQASFAYGDEFIGNRSLELTLNQKVTWSFYCDSDEMLVYPSIYLFNNSNVSVFLNNNKSPQPKPLDFNRDLSASEISSQFNISSTSSKVINQPPSQKPIDAGIETNEFIKINGRGYHTITIQVVNGDCRVSGLQFWSPSRINPQAIINNYTSGDIEDAVDGIQYFAFSGATGKPGTESIGLFKKSQSADKSIGMIEWYVTQGPDIGKKYYKYKLGGAWGGWTLNV